MKVYFSMFTALLVVILLSFIGVGLPDSVLGTAWPAIYTDFSLPVSLAGYITIAVSCGTVISSLMSATLIRRFGTGLVTAVSTALTAVGLLGCTFAPHIAWFFVFAIPLGLGAGAVDTALNNFVALHYSISALSFLHCCYGIGVAASPFVMSLALGDDGNWRRGYFIVAMIQCFITVVAVAALPLWKRVQKKDREEQTEETLNIPIPRLLRTPAVLMTGFAFIFSCAVELTAGGWSSTYFVNVRGIGADHAAAITMLFYIGLSLGRAISGLIAGRIGRRRLLRISLYILALALIVFALPFGNVLASVALFIMGLAIGPIYPNLVHLTPKHFGRAAAQSVMGVQQAMTYIGIMIMPPLFGTLAEWLTPAILPYFLMVMYVFYALDFLILMRTVKRVRKANVSLLKY